MNSRRKQPEITRKAILRSAGEGFALQGYAATGIGEISKGSGLTRGALFHHFPDKQSLALAWVDDELEPALLDAHASRLEGTDTFRAWKDGCVALLEEIAPHHPISLFNRLGAEWSADPVLRAAMARVRDAWHTKVSETLARGQREGWIHRSIQPDAEAQLLISLWCGASLLLGLEDRAPLIPLGRAMASYLDTLRSEG